MSFAAVLDAPIGTGDQNQFKTVRAAGFALRHLATKDEQLLFALKFVDDFEESRKGELATVLTERFDDVLSTVSGATGVSADEIAGSLVSQLRQVVSFANLDGGELENNVGAVANLIRSGRVELFAG